MDATIVNSALTLLAGIVGGLIGGATTYVVHIREIKEKRNFQAEVEQAQTISKLSKLHVQIQYIKSNSKNIHKHFQEQLEKLPKDFNDEDFLSKYIMPYLSVPDKIFLDTDSITLLLILKEKSAFNSAIGLDTFHNTLIQTLNIFNDKQMQFYDSLPKTEVTKNTIGSNMSKEEFQEHAYKAFLNDGLIKDLNDLSLILEKEAQKCLEEVSNILKNNNGPSITMKFDV